jgi:hypothetical protein
MDELHGDTSRLMRAMSSRTMTAPVPSISRVEYKAGGSLYNDGGEGAVGGDVCTIDLSHSMVGAIC